MVLANVIKKSVAQKIYKEVVARLKYIVVRIFKYYVLFCNLKYIFVCSSWKKIFIEKLIKSLKWISMCFEHLS